MNPLPPLRLREIIRGLNALGFDPVRQKGSHQTFHHSDCRRTAIPIHPTKQFSRYLLSDILKQLEIDEEEFVRAAKRKR